MTVDKHEPLKLAVTHSPKRFLRECTYCGALTYGKACPAHRDLIQVDPNEGGTG